MSVQVAAHLSKKKVVRKLDGSVVDWYDEADGGWIIRGGAVVNQAKFDEIARKERDKAEAAKAQAQAINNPVAPVEDRVAAPSKVDALEKRVSGMEDTLSQILAAVKK